MRIARALILLTVFATSISQGEALRLGTNVWPGYEPLYLARELGSFEKKRIKLVEYLSASEVIRAFRNRQLEAAALTLDEVFLLLEREIPVQIVLVTDISNGGDAILARPGITDIAMLKSKKVAVEAGALGAYVISRALEKNDLTLADIQVVNLEVSEHETAFKTGAVDAVVTFEPVRSRLLAAGATEVFSSRDIPGEIVDVIAVHRDYLANDTNAVHELIEGWFAALRYLEENPDAAAKHISLRMRMPPADVLRSYEGLDLPGRDRNHALLGGTSPGLIEVARRLQDIMVRAKLLRQSVEIDDLMSSEFLAPAN